MVKHLTKRERTAYHEAGHAVLAERLGLNVTRVAIDPSSEGQGVVSYSEPTADQWQLREAEAIAALGGVCSEGKISGKMNPPSYAEDLAAARDSLVLFREKAGLPTDEATIHRELNRAVHTANDAVAAAWEAIETVAAQLLVAGELDGDALAAILDSRDS